MIEALWFNVRALACVIWFVLISLISILIGLIRWRSPQNGHFMSQAFTRGTMWILGYKIIIKNAERLRAHQPCIYIANHQSNLDFLTLAHSFPPETVCIGKKEIIWIPLFGILFYLSGNILLNRKHHQSAMQRMQLAKQYILEKGHSIYMFPEGTRNRGAKTLLPFKKGAFYLAVGAQVPLVPVVAAPIESTIDLKNKRMAGKEFHIHVLEPIATIGKTEADVPELIALAQSKMQAEFNLMTCRLS